MHRCPHCNGLISIGAEITVKKPVLLCSENGEITELTEDSELYKAWFGASTEPENVEKER